MGKESKTKNKTITEAKLKKLARYELSFQDVFGPEEKEWGEVPVKKRISASPEDLLAALDKGEKLPYQQFRGWSRFGTGDPMPFICTRRKAGAAASRATRALRGSRN